MTDLPHGSLRSYAAGFALSLAATFAAYALVVGHALAGGALAGAVVALALLQLAAQLVLFLHLGRRTDTWNLVALAFALIVVCIVVAGSLWIMRDLQGRMMLGPGAMMDYMQQEAGSP